MNRPARWLAESRTHATFGDRPCFFEKWLNCTWLRCTWFCFFLFVKLRETFNLELQLLLEHGTDTWTEKGNVHDWNHQYPSGSLFKFSEGRGDSTSLDTFPIWRELVHQQHHYLQSSKFSTSSNPRDKSPFPLRNPDHQWSRHWAKMSGQAIPSWRSRNSWKLNLSNHNQLRQLDWKLTEAHRIP